MKSLITAMILGVMLFTPMSTQAQKYTAPKGCASGMTASENRTRAATHGYKTVYVVTDPEQILRIQGGILSATGQERFYASAPGVGVKGTNRLGAPDGDMMIVWRHRNPNAPHVYVDLVLGDCLIATLRMQSYQWNSVVNMHELKEME